MFLAPNIFSFLQTELNHDAPSIRYQPEWKETLHGHVGHHRFTIELTMGVLHVYFPSETTWNQRSPKWAEGLWPHALEEAKKWSNDAKIPLTVDDTAWVDFN